MKVNELLEKVNTGVSFDMYKELEIKEYLPIDEKKLIAKGIIYESTEMVNGVLKVDSVQRYLYYVKYMIQYHTNLEYGQEDYDALCSTEYGDTNLLNAIMSCFGEDANECSRILNLMIDDRMQENSMEFIVGGFLNGLGEMLKDKLDGFDLNSIIPKDMDKDKLINFLNTYV